MITNAQLKGLRQHLGVQIKGQEEATEELCKAVEIAELRLVESGKPRGSFLLLGPPGTGKTYTCDILSEYLFGPDRLIRFDMSEFATAESLPRFVGDRAGQLGRLGDALALASEGLLLFDGFDNSHPVIQDEVCKIIRRGYATVGAGKKVSVSDFYLVCTSSIGVAKMPDASTEVGTMRMVTDELRAKMRPEHLESFSSILFYYRLRPQIRLEIGKKILEAELERLGRQGAYQLSYGREVVEFLSRMNSKEDQGARPMIQKIRNQVQAAVARSVLEKGTGSGVLTLDRKLENLEVC